MTFPCVDAFVEVLCQCELLAPAQLEAIRGDIAKQLPNPRVLAQELLRQGWLTPFQVNQLFLGRAADLLLGHYVVLERLGEGGVGQVFKARHRRMNRIVALKLIRRERLSDSETVGRFLREIQVVSQLSHPNVVHAFDAGPAGTGYFLAMEYVEGTDLAKLVRQSGPLPVAQATDYIRQAALGLQHAHERGLVHRDVKPPNFLVTQLPDKHGHRKESAASSSTWQAQAPAASSWGLVKLLDLGLARLQRTVDGERTNLLTPAGPVMMGTPDYMSPEQAIDFHRTDIRGDIYSLGCTFYFLLAGQPPFPSGSLAQKLLRHQQAEPTPIEQLRPDVSPDIAAVLRRMLAKRPEDRFQTPGAIAEQLASLLGTAHVSGEPRLPTSSAPAGTLKPPMAILLPSKPCLADQTPKIVPPAEATRPPLPVAIPVAPPPRRRAWVKLAAGIGLLGLMTLSVVLLARRSLLVPGQSPSGQPTSWPATAASNFSRLQQRWEDPREDRVQLRQDLLAFQRSKPGTAEAVRAAQLVAGLPSPLDRLAPKSIPAVERLPWQPPELVAVLGEQRQRHWGEVYAVAWSPDGRWIASGGQDLDVRLWDPVTMQPRAVLRGHGSYVHSLAFAPDSRTLASASQDYTVRLWDVSGAEPRPRCVLKGHHNHVMAVAFAPDGQTLASAGDDCTIHLWNLSTEKPTLRGVLKGHSSDIFALAFAPDNRTLASGSKDGTVRLWDLTAAQPREGAVLKALSRGVYTLAFAPDGKTLVVGGQDTNPLRLWDVTGAEPRQQPILKRAHGRQAVSAAIFNREGTTLVSAGHDQKIQLWDFTKAIPQERFQLVAHVGHVRAIALSPDGQKLVSGSLDGTVRLWDLSATPPREHNALKPCTGAVRCVAFISDDHKLLSGNEDGAVRQWMLQEATLQEQVLFKEPTGRLRTMAVAPDGSALALSFGRSSTLWLWELAGTDLRQRAGLTGSETGLAMYAAAFSADSRLLTAGNLEKGVTLWDLSRPSPSSLRLGGNSARVTAVAFTPDGRTVVCGSDDFTLRLWDRAGVLDQERAILKGHTSSISSIAVAPDGKLLATAGSYDRTARLWRLDGGQPREGGILPGHTRRAVCVAFAPNGQLLASSGEKELLLWEVASGKKLKEWPLPGAVDSLAFASDSRHLAAGGSNGTIYLFRVSNPPSQR